MIKRLIPVLCVLSILFSCFVPAVGAVSEVAADPPVNSILDYKDFVSGFRYVEESKIETVSFPSEYCSIYTKTLDGTSQTPGAVSDQLKFTYKKGCYGSVKFCFPGLRYSDPRYYVSLDNIQDGSPLHLFSRFVVDPDFEGSFDTKIWYQINYYDEDFTNIAVLPAKPKSLTFENCTGRFVGVFETSNETDNAFHIPDGAKYFGISLVLRVENIALAGAAEGSSKDLSFDFGFSDYALDVSQELPPFDAGSVFSVFGSVGTWFTDQIGSLTSIFWDADAGTLTFIGILAVCALAVAVIVLIIYICSRFLHFRS